VVARARVACRASLRRRRRERWLAPPARAVPPPRTLPTAGEAPRARRAPTLDSSLAAPPDRARAPLLRDRPSLPAPSRAGGRPRRFGPRRAGAPRERTDRSPREARRTRGPRARRAGRHPRHLAR